jgi:hypothetical protein
MGERRFHVCLMVGVNALESGDGSVGSHQPSRSMIDVVLGHERSGSVRFEVVPPGDQSLGGADGADEPEVASGFGDRHGGNGLPAQPLAAVRTFESGADHWTGVGEPAPTGVLGRPFCRLRQVTDSGRTTLQGGIDVPMRLDPAVSHVDNLARVDEGVEPLPAAAVRRHLKCPFAIGCQTRMMTLDMVKLCELADELGFLHGQRQTGCGDGW